MNVTNYGDLVVDASASGPLKLFSSIIADQCLCQLLKLKSGGQTFISILLADIVLLSAA